MLLFIYLRFSDNDNTVNNKNNSQNDINATIKLHAVSATAPNETFDLRPNKQRTKGKKSKAPACALL